jgi:hypothetical protein
MGVRVATHVALHACCGVWRASAVQRWTCSLSFAILRKEWIPLSDGAYDTGSDRSSQSHVASPTELSDVPTDTSFSVSIMHMGSWREVILVWDEEDDFCVNKESEHLLHEWWDERLVQYLDTVDKVLFGGSKHEVSGSASRSG